MENIKRYKVSIVTAVYNAEEYLGETIESIINQTIGFENVQMILVNDGSADGSKEICDKYAAEYPENIVAVHKENGGVSSARNEGLKHVKGEYINFLDSDDKLEENALEVMYDYLEENKEWIDLVAIPLKFFGAREGGHPLNYKFKKTKIVDLKKEYNFVQLSLSAAMVKSSCFKERRFDTELAYAEDAQLLTDIVIDKMRYGVISETSYLYRKREAGNSAIDTGRMKQGYYVPWVKKFILFSIQNAIKKKGYLPKYVQYVCMYDLQWRLNKYPLVEQGVLDNEEEKEYKALLIEAIQYIDNDVIQQQKNLSDNYKTAIFMLKEENRNNNVLEYLKDDVRICAGDTVSAGMASYSAVYEFLTITSTEILLEGYVRCFQELGNVEIVLKSSTDEVDEKEFFATLIDRDEKNSYFMDEVITKAWGFCVKIDRNDLLESQSFQLFVRRDGHDICCKNIIFGKFFSIGKKLKNSYLYKENLLVTYENNVLLLEKTTRRNVKKHERTLLKEMWKSKDAMIRRGMIARCIYNMLKNWKKKEIWLISDRLTKADDNGEAFFTYMNTKNKDTKIDTYFVVNKSTEDYKRLKKMGKVVSYDSTKYKILALLCDKIISAQADDYAFNRFYDLSHLYRDITSGQKFIFLQHGVTKDDLSRWLNRFNKNISILVTTTKDEYQSILDSKYYYDDRQVKLTGFPRYDYLTDNSKEKRCITFMPTWRSYLAGNLDVKTDTRTLKPEFETSEFCKMYRRVFSDKKLFEMAEKYHYTIQIMLHPTMPVECLEYFECNSNLKILDRNVQYRKLFADSNLIVTDYSSTVFDFAYLRKPVLYFQQDKDEFFSGKHTYDKGYFEYESDGFGEVEYTAEALVNRIIEYMENGCRLKNVYRERIEKTFPYNDKDNCKRVYEEIVKLS